MEDDFFYLAFIVGGVGTLIWWLTVCFAPTQRLVPSAAWRLILFASVGVNGAILLTVLTTWASFDVVTDPFYITAYLMLGMLWVYATVPWLGSFADIRIKQDVRGHNNVAAATLIAAFTIGTTMAYSGANVGDGPGWYVVVFCSILSTAATFGVAFSVATLTDTEERITIDHDLGAAIRLGGAIIAAGLIAGRSAAGDWVSVGGTIVDFAVGAWPILAIAAIAVVIERIMPPNYLANRLPHSILIALAMVGGAWVYVGTLGPW